MQALKFLRNYSTVTPLCRENFSFFFSKSSTGSANSSDPRGFVWCLWNNFKFVCVLGYTFHFLLNQINGIHTNGIESRKEEQTPDQWVRQKRWPHLTVWAPDSENRICSWVWLKILSLLRGHTWRDEASLSPYDPPLPGSCLSGNVESGLGAVTFQLFFLTEGFGFIVKSSTWQLLRTKFLRFLIF